MNQHAPAYPPQVLLDNFQRPVAPIPGFTKLEAAALALLPYFLDLAERRNDPTEGIQVHAIRDAIGVAESFLRATHQRYKDDTEGPVLHAVV